MQTVIALPSSASCRVSKCCTRSAATVLIVRDMWLTGFDVPCLTTMYVDKPMKDHNLMQAIARVNRVFHDKPGGLVVDYIGIANDLKKALQEYTESKGNGRPTIPAAEMLLKVHEEMEVARGMLDRKS